MRTIFDIAIGSDEEAKRQLQQHKVEIARLLFAEIHRTDTKSTTRISAITAYYFINVNMREAFPTFRAIAVSQDLPKDLRMTAVHAIYGIAFREPEKPIAKSAGLALIDLYINKNDLSEVRNHAATLISQFQPTARQSFQAYRQVVRDMNEEFELRKQAIAHMRTLTFCAPEHADKILGALREISKDPCMDPRIRTLASVMADLVELDAKMLRISAGANRRY